MNRHWRVEFLLLEAAAHPEWRDAWETLAAEWMVEDYLGLGCWGASRT